MRGGLARGYGHHLAATEGGYREGARRQPGAQLHRHRQRRAAGGKQRGTAAEAGAAAEAAAAAAAGLLEQAGRRARIDAALGRAAVAGEAAGACEEGSIAHQHKQWQHSMQAAQHAGACWLAQIGQITSMLYPVLLVLCGDSFASECWKLNAWQAHAPGLAAAPGEKGLPAGKQLPAAPAPALPCEAAAVELERSGADGGGMASGAVGPGLLTCIAAGWLVAGGDTLPNTRCSSASAWLDTDSAGTAPRKGNRSHRLSKSCKLWSTPCR